MKIREVSLSPSAKKALCAFFFLLGMLCLLLFLDFSLLVSKKMVVFASVLLLIFVSFALAFFAKQIAPFLPARLGSLARWIHSSIIEIYLIPIVYLLLPLAIFPWKIRGGDKKPILLIHGYIHFSSVWALFLHRLKKKGWGPVYTINLGMPFRSIESFAEKVGRKVAKIHKETNQGEIILIGHSMGGLVASYFALHQKSEMKVTDIITIGSPLHGTKMANIALGLCAKEMLRGSFLTKDLSQKIAEEKEIQFYHIASLTDQIIRPFTSSLMQQNPENEYVLQDTGHVKMLFSKEVFEKVLSWIT